MNPHPSLPQAFTTAAEAALTLYKTLASSITVAPRNSTEEVADLAHDVALIRVTMLGLHERLLSHHGARARNDGIEGTGGTGMDRFLEVIKGVVDEVSR